MLTHADTWLEFKLEPQMSWWLVLIEYKSEGLLHKGYMGLEFVPVSTFVTKLFKQHHFPNNTFEVIIEQFDTELKKLSQWTRRMKCHMIPSCYKSSKTIEKFKKTVLLTTTIPNFISKQIVFHLSKFKDLSRIPFVLLITVEIVNSAPISHSLSNLKQLLLV